MKQHKISLFTAILLNINIMVGSGILAGPGLMAAIAGNASFLAWPLVALFFLPLVLSIVTLSGMCPGAGGFYAYAKLGLNQRAGYMSGLLYIIGYTFAVAAEILVLRTMLLSSFGPQWFLTNQLIYNFWSILLCTLFNLMSLRVISNVLNSITITKLIPLVTLIILLPFFFTTNFTITSAELSMLPFALPMAIFGYFGFEYCCSISHLIENSEKNGPRAILLGFLITAAIYTLFNFGLLMLMGSANLSTYTASAFANFLSLPVPYLKEIFMFLIPAASIVTLFAGANGMINANASMLQAMAHESTFKGDNFLTLVNRFNRPWIAVVLQGIVVYIITCLLPSIGLVFNLCNFSIFTSFILPFVSLMVLQRRAQTNYRLIMTALALLVVIVMAGYSWFNLGATMYERIINTTPFIIAIVLGLLVEKR